MSMRIENTFEKCRRENRGVLVIYLTMGLPTVEASAELACSLIESGADIIELGVPFSDPTADGPVIQTAGNIALQNGATLQKILDAAKTIRARFPETPLVLFSYHNVLLNRGLEKLAAELEEIGVDGVLTVDLPYEERDEFLPICRKHDIAMIPLVSPESGAERAAKIAEGMKGFVYCITVRGVTGVRSELPAEVKSELEDFRKVVAPLPTAAGFGISTPEMAGQAAQAADAVVVGSAMVKIMLEAPTPEEGIKRCSAFTRTLAAACAHR